MSSSAPTTTAAASVVHKSSFHDCSRFVENSFTPAQQKTCYTQQQHQQQHNEQKKTIIYLAGLVIRNCFQDRAIFSHLPIVNVGAASATSLLLLPFISSSLFFFFFCSCSVLYRHRGCYSTPQNHTSPYHLVYVYWRGAMCSHRLH